MERMKVVVTKAPQLLKVVMNPNMVAVLALRCRHMERRDLVAAQNLLGVVVPISSPPLLHLTSRVATANLLPLVVAQTA